MVRDITPRIVKRAIYSAAILYAVFPKADEWTKEEYEY
jgi:hypothetical protein